MEKVKNTPQGKSKYKKATNLKNKNDIQKQNTITWESPDGKTARQIDYISISHRYRNAVIKENAVKGWQANMAQQQHKVIRMDIRLRLMKHSKKNQPPETGMQIKYDLTELREDPQKTERWLTQREEPPEFHNNTTAAEDWGKIKKPIQQALETIYPKKNHKKGEKTKHQNGQKGQNNGAPKKNGKECNNT